MRIRKSINSDCDKLGKCNYLRISVDDRFMSELEGTSYLIKICEGGKNKFTQCLRYDSHNAEVLK